MVYAFYDKKSVKILKGATRNRKSKKDTQHNGQKNKEKKGQKTINKTLHIKKTSNTNPTNTGSELRCPGSVSSSGSTNDTRRVNLVTNPVISHE
jgi:hypothetical protein